MVDSEGPRPGALARYDPVADQWAKLTRPSDPWSLLVAGDSELFAIAGSDEQGPARDEMFDPDSRSWHRIPDDPLGPSFDRDAVWFGGRLLLAAKKLVASPGATAPSLVRLAWWDPTSRRWSEPASTELFGWTPRAVGRTIVWPDTGSSDGGRIGNWGRRYPAGGILRPGDGSWTDLPQPPDRNGLVAPGLVVGSRIVVGPALDPSRGRIGGHLLDPATGRWTDLPPLPGPERTEAAMAASDDIILVWGGADVNLRNLADGYVLRT